MLFLADACANSNLPHLPVSVPSLNPWPMPNIACSHLSCSLEAILDPQLTCTLSSPSPPTSAQLAPPHPWSSLLKSMMEKEGSMVIKLDSFKSEKDPANSFNNLLDLRLVILKEMLIQYDRKLLPLHSYHMISRVFSRYCNKLKPTPSA